MLTNGGMGVALLWPLSDERLFFPTRVIEVSPLSISHILSPRGVVVFSSELLWIWLPALAICITAIAARRLRPR